MPQRVGNQRMNSRLLNLCGQNTYLNIPIHQLCKTCLKCEQMTRCQLANLRQMPDAERPNVCIGVFFLHFPHIFKGISLDNSLIVKPMEGVYSRHILGLPENTSKRCEAQLPLNGKGAGVDGCPHSDENWSPPSVRRRDADGKPLYPCVKPYR